MIDFFGRKAKAELKALQTTLANQAVKHNAEINAFIAGNDNLIRQLREVDQLVYTLGQQYGQTDIRETLLKLCGICAGRQQKESDRIRDVLIPEIRGVYTQRNDGDAIDSYARTRIGKS